MKRLKDTLFMQRNVKMQKWEYYVLYITWDRDRKEFYLDIQSRGKVFGEEKILDYYGQQGWELVGVVPSLTRGEFGFSTRAENGAFAAGLHDYRLFLKRPKS